MNKIATGVVMMTTVLFMSCGSSDSPEVDKSIMPAADTSKAVQTALPSNVQAQPVATPAPNTQNVQTISAADAASAMPSAGLNPAHGQPGHRCDIAVGAPLNSAPATATQPKMTPATQPVSVSAPAAITTSAAPADPNAKVNPAHGQPGHDCSIPVGAPLKKS